MSKFTEILNKFLFYSPVKNEDTQLLDDENLNIEYDSRKNYSEKDLKVSDNIDDNLRIITERFNVPKNNDVVIRIFNIKGDIKCFIIYYEGMSDTAVIDNFIIKGLIELPYIMNTDVENLARKISEDFLLHSQVKMTDSIDALSEEVNFGCCGLFIDGLNQCFHMDVKKWEHRSIDKPENEQSVYGPQEAFNEMLRTNTILIRKILKTEKLIAEAVKVGEMSKTSGVLLYIDGIANEKLINLVKKRLNSISVDVVYSTEEISQFIENSNYSLFSQTVSSERPDRVARALADGRVAYIMNGSPRAIIFPSTFYELTHAASDAYIKAPYANMARIVRYIGMFVSVLLPALYLAITLFHQEMLPTYLLYAISAARSNVPFPSVLELLLMDLSFELIREAGLRMPGAVGQTLGIVGGLILGQSAVSAKIVSPIMIVVIAITGIGSFSTSDYSLSWTFRILRIVFILLASVAGFFGIALGLFVLGCYLTSLYNFGVPFMSPFPGTDNNGYYGAVLVKKIWKRETRPEYLDAKNKKREPKISRGWFGKK